MSLVKTVDVSTQSLTTTASKHSTKRVRVPQNAKEKKNAPKAEGNQLKGDAGSQLSLSSKVKSVQERKCVNQIAGKNDARKKPVWQLLSKQACREDGAGRRKPSINPEVRRVAQKSDPWRKKSVETKSKPTKPAKYVSPYSKGVLMPAAATTTTAKPAPNGVKPVDGRRPVLKMPANIPRASKRKNRYVITVVGNEIKLLDPKPRSLKSESSRVQLPVFNNGATVSIRAEKLPPPKRRRKKAKDPEAPKKEPKKEEAKKSDEPSSKSVIKVMHLGGNQRDFNSSDLNLTVARLNLSSGDDVKRVGRFSDRRTKIDLVEKPECLTKDVALLERLDPISNILNTEYADSVQRCQAITDFLTEPTENPNPPSFSKRIFYDTTVMEELDFPPLLSSDLGPDTVELTLVPRYLPEDAQRTLSWPMSAPSKSDVRRHPLSSHNRKKRPKLETILSTRPKGFHHAKWLEKTVASDSHLKTRLLRDVIVSQVKKLLKKQAELRGKMSERNLDGLEAESNAGKP